MGYFRLGTYGGKNQGTTRAGTEVDFATSTVMTRRQWGAGIFGRIRGTREYLNEHGIPSLQEAHSGLRERFTTDFDHQQNASQIILALHKVTYGDYYADGSGKYDTTYVETFSDSTALIRPSTKFHFAVQTGFAQLRSNPDRPGQYDNYWDGYLFEVPLAGPGNWRFTCNRDLTEDYIVELAIEHYQY